jgi:mevalonate pyrophosphate decarboxylase
MQRSSSSIANLAAALAKAQIALVNPEKSLVATIRQGGASGCRTNELLFTSCESAQLRP